MFSRISRFLRALVVVAPLVACAGQQSQPERLRLMLPPEAFGATVSLQQHLRIEHQGRVDELDAALEIDSQRLDLIALMLGQRVLSLHYDGNKLQSWRHPMVPVQLRDEDVLQDVQLSLWPVDVIRRALPAGWRIEEDGLRRILLSGDTPVTVIEYSGNPRWSGKVELTNLRYRYRLTIESVSNGS